MANDTQDYIFLAVICATLIIFLMLPVMIAALRHHPATATIARLTPLALLSMALWLALFAWAALDRKNDGVISAYVEKLRARKRFSMFIFMLIGMGIAVLAVSLWPMLGG